MKEWVAVFFRFCEIRLTVVYVVCMCLYVVLLDPFLKRRATGWRTMVLIAILFSFFSSVYFFPLSFSPKAKHGGQYKYFIRWELFFFREAGNRWIEVVYRNIIAE